MNRLSDSIPVYLVRIYLKSGDKIKFETTWFQYFESGNFEYEVRAGGPVAIDKDQIAAITVTLNGEYVLPQKNPQIVRLP